MKIFAYSQGEYKDRPLYFAQLSPDGDDMKTDMVSLEQKGRILMYLNGLYRKDDPKDDEWVAEYELWCRMLFFWNALCLNPRHLGISGGAAWSVVYEDFLRQLPTEAGIKYLRAVLSLERVIAEAPAHAHGWFYLPDWPAPGKATP